MYKSRHKAPNLALIRLPPGVPGRRDLLTNLAGARFMHHAICMNLCTLCMNLRT